MTWRDDNHDPTADLVLIGLLCLLAWGVVALGHRAAGECAADVQTAPGASLEPSVREWRD